MQGQAQNNMMPFRPLESPSLDLIMQELCFTTRGTDRQQVSEGAHLPACPVDVP